MSRNFEVDFSLGAVTKITTHAGAIRHFAAQMGVSPLGVAGSIMREITAADKVYKIGGSAFVWHFADAIRAYAIATFLSHEELEADYLSGARTTSVIWRGLGQYPVSNDVGPGRVKIATAIDMLLEYRAKYGNVAQAGGPDPLGLSKYYQRYDLLANDLLGDFETTIKFATLVAKEAEEFFRSQGVHEADSSSTKQWNEYSKEQQAALVVKYYSAGREKVVSGSAGFKHYDMTGDGSDMFLYNENSSIAARSLGQDLGILALSVEKPSRDGGAQFFKIDFPSTSSNSVATNFLLKSHPVGGEYSWSLDEPSVGPVRIEVAKIVKLSSAADQVVLDKGLTPIMLRTWIDASAGNDKLNASSWLPAGDPLIADFKDVARQTIRSGYEIHLKLRNFEDFVGRSEKDKFIGAASKAASKAADPLIFDLDGDGIEVTQVGRASPFFDIDGDGWTEQTAWATGGDGLLVRDVNGNGSIDGLTELFGSESESGFAALGVLDSNADGLIDANDVAFSTLRVWVDANGDALSTADELKSLAALGIASIEVTKSEIGQLIRDLDGDGFYEDQATLVGHVAAGEGFVISAADLALFDINADGAIDAQDAGFDTLRVWNDTSADGVTDADEIRTPGELGLTSIGLHTTEPTESEREINGNAVTAVGAYKLADGTVRRVADVALAYYDGGGRPSGGSNPPSDPPPSDPPPSDPSAPDDDREFRSEADGGKGEDTVDYSTFEEHLVISVSADNPVAVDTGVVKHKLVNFEVLVATKQEDKILWGADAPNETDGVADKADVDPKSKLTIDGGGQGKTTPAGPNPKPADEAYANGGRGDLVDAALRRNGIVIDLRDPDNQFVVDAKGKLPTRLGLEGKFPVNGLVQQLQFYNLVRDELTEPTDRSGYQSNERLNLKNAESVFGTSYNDLIIGADAVYTWKLPDPPPPSEDPNAPPPPPPVPQKVVDKDFAGYDLIGGAGDDTILIYNGNKDQVTFHKVDGGDGKDVIAIRTDGKTQYKGPLTGAVTNSTIDGGAKDDAIFVFGGGEGLQVFGGQGRDFIYVKPNASPEKMPFVEVYGDTIDGRKEEPVVDGNGQPVLDDKGNPLTQSVSVEDTKENADLFWFAHGVAIKDAQHHDILAFYGMPLTGGNIAAGGAFAVAATSIGGYTGGGLAWAGFQTTIAANTNYEGKKPGWTGGLFWDNLVPFINYVYDINTNTMFVTNYIDALSALIIGHDENLFNNEGLRGHMRIERFDMVASLLGALQQESTSGPWGGQGYKNYQGTLNMVFKQINPVSVILDMLPPSAITFGIQAAFGGSPLIDAAFTLAAAATRWSKALGWAEEADPLVLDLNGNGIEFIDLNRSNVYFDLDGDKFAERTAWLKGSDAFLAVDENHNGRIDDIAEMFGGVGVSGYQELAQFDSSGDGVIDAGDARWLELKVWRDLNQNGVTDAGELQTLADTGITALSAAANPLGATTPQGVYLSSYGSFTRADGTTGRAFDSILPMDNIDTKYAGETGRAAWQQDTTLNSKGFGMVTDLAVATANDIGLGALAASTAAAMTTPKLKTLVAQAGEVLGAWGAAMPLTQELVAVRLGVDAAGKTVLLDRAEYVEDAAGGYWTLHSNAPVLDASGNAIARATLGISGRRRRDLLQRSTHSCQPRQTVSVRPRIAA